MRVFLFGSRSNPSAPPHRTRTNASGAIVDCSCRGYRASASRECLHVRAVLDAFASGNFTLLREERTGQEAFGFIEEVPPPPRTPSIEIAMGGYVEPMLASALDDEKTIEDYADGSWVLEEKYDGHRLIVRVVTIKDGARAVCAWSRAGNVRKLPPQIIEAAQVLASGTYDGELYVPGGTSTDVTAIERAANLRLALFDILAVSPDDVTLYPGKIRRDFLNTAGTYLRADHAIELAPQFPVTREGLDAIWARGGEGAIIKQQSAPYLSGRRAKTWVKFKKFLAGRATITGFLAGKLGPCSIVVGRDKDGVEVRAKARNDEWRATFEADPESFFGRTLVFEHQGKAKRGRYRSAMADHLEDA